jgi:crossover junction endodeoxyribonuclease RuvC
MRVLGIDPGYDRVGVAVLEYQNGTEMCLHSNCIETTKTDSLVERYCDVAKAIRELITEHAVNTVAIEQLFFNKNVKTAMQVAEARGVIMVAACEMGVTLHEFSPQAIKIATTGHGNSSKDAVTQMVRQLVRGVPTRALDDEYDAIAVGVTCLAHHGRKQ